MMESGDLWSDLDQQNDWIGSPLLKSSVGDTIWQLRSQNENLFRQRLIDYFSLGYPGWSIVKVEYPLIYLRDDRRTE
ncbi:hypothetical protein J15TS10_49680 [Paenibacillus woosongensis]|uniref:Uncharacterized protein n=1 Tax=Paenibacillus woosongensis TaxID=307580 RepID=A0ABQ4MZ19_9BACL|nr:hypothetical protein J15TS10_49680 [Paenibacillus woosongensis]